MVLTDKEIREYASNKKLILSPFRESDLGSVSYDLRINNILLEDKQTVQSYGLYPGQSVIVESKDIIQTTDKTIGIVLEKNSLMRLGLLVRGTVIQPGHKTRCYLIVTNLSQKRIVLDKDMRIAHIMFRKLEQAPETTYSQNENSSFADELNYTGYGKYEEEYTERSLD